MRAESHAKQIADSIGLTRRNVLVTSSQTRAGREELLQKIETVIPSDDEEPKEGKL